MSTITALEQQKKRADRYSVFVDGQFVIGVGEAMVADLGLRAGRTISPDDLLALAGAEEVRKAMDSVFGLLAVRARSEREITTRLTQKGYEEDTIRQVIEKLRGLDLVNDADFAAQWVAARSSATAGRPIGKRRLSAELFQKGIDKDQVAEALNRVSEVDELALARAAAAKKVHTIPNDPALQRAERNKLTAFLQRRGFGWETIKQVLDDIFDPEDPFADTE